MHRALTVLAVAFLAACDPLVHETLRVSPGREPAIAAAAIGPVALRFGLQPYAGRSETAPGTRAWQGPIEANGHSQLYIRAVSASDGGLTVTVGEMFTNRWSPRGDSLRRAIADTLRQLEPRAP